MRPLRVTLLSSALLVGGLSSTALGASPALADVTAAQAPAQQAALTAVQQGHEGQRRAAKLDPLVRDPKLDAVAQAWSDRMAARSDAGEGGSALKHSPDEPAYDYAKTMPGGWRGAAENIAYNWGDGPGMFQMWMGSAGHRANIDNPAFDSAGYGISYDRAGRMWGTVVFGDYASGARPPLTTSTPAPTSTTTAAPAVPTRRLSGADRYATGVALAPAVATAPTAVVLASGERLVDSVPAAPLAKALGGPLLLTTTGTLSPAVAAHLRATPSVRTAVLVGGESSIAPAVADELRALGLTVERVSGADRYATALAVAARPELASATTAYVARGSGSLADAVAVGGTAAALRSPVLLAPPSDPGPALVAATETRTTVVVGGTTAVPEPVAAALGADGRLQGADRYATAAAVADHAVSRGVKTDRVLVASGDDARLADALVSGAAGNVTLLVRPGGWGTATTAWLTGHRTGEVIAVGGATPTR